MSNILQTKLTTLGLVGLSSISFAISAQENTIVSCADIKDSESRLSCYDKAAELSRDLPVVRLPRGEYSSPSSGSEPAPARVDQFGFGRKGDGARTRSYRVVEAKHNDFTGWTIEFDNGSIWKQVGAEDFRIEIGSLYSIRRNSFNSYMLSNEKDNNKIRISRVD